MSRHNPTAFDRGHGPFSSTDEVRGGLPGAVVGGLLGYDAGGPGGAIVGALVGWGIGEELVD